MQSKTNIKASNSFQTQDMFPILIKICQKYLSEEDLDLLMKNILTSPNFIFNINGKIQIMKSKYVPIDFDFLKSTILHSQELPLTDYHKNQSLDFLFAFDLINRIKNLDSLIEDIGSIIRPLGLFAFTYYKVCNRHISGKKEYYFESVENQTITYSHFDGYIQKLLLINNFYIQNEFEWPIDNKKNIEIVLIVAQKKNYNI